MTSLVRIVTALLFAVSCAPAFAQFQPQVGQAGKDVIWVPTPPVLLEKMLDMAQVTPQDYVIDLGSGDGRNVIAAAKRGARALGVEYDRELLHLSRRNAADAGVAERARFVEGDMFEADLSAATVLALFLLPDNLQKLKPKFERLKPGSRIVSHYFAIPGVVPDKTVRTTSEEDEFERELLLYTVPLKRTAKKPAQ